MREVLDQVIYLDSSAGKGLPLSILVKVGWSALFGAVNEPSLRFVIRGILVEKHLIMLILKFNGVQLWTLLSQNSEICLFIAQLALNLLEPCNDRLKVKLKDLIDCDLKCLLDGVCIGHKLRIESRTEVVDHVLNPWDE
jgi:hypothetical protein